MNEPSALPAQDVPMVGVFRSLTQADEAISALKDAHFGEDQMSMTEYRGTREENSRIVVRVSASGRDQEAVGILVHNGANNSDLPSGTELVRGNLIVRNPDTISELSQQPTQVNQAALPPSPDFTEYRGQ